MTMRLTFQRRQGFRTAIVGALLLAFAVSHAGCFLDETIEPYYGRVVTPRAQEFHWSDGGLPQTFDPAFAAAPPDTDLVRAIFEGLTDYDPRTLTPVPAVATRWEPTNGGRVWTFYLREDARWSNGDPVTAGDFVRSWQRITKIGDLAPHTVLLDNIEGADRRTVSSLPKEADKKDSSESPVAATQPAFGVEALSDRVLRVRLRRADMNFPALVAHPVFRPVKLNEDSSTTKLTVDGLVSNGAFSVAKTESQRVLLERAHNYWDKQQVTLERVTFVGQKDAESALAAYQAGEIDAVTNAAFEPLAIKLLAPYEDFRRTTYSALTYYTFNTSHQPFDDVRVREALALALDRDRISTDDLGGATEPAKRFLPEAVGNSEKPVVEKSELLEKDEPRARELLADAGFPGGEGFPTVRLLINRNEQQRIVAQSVAAMWRNVLNIETEIIILNWDDYEAAIRSGDFDVVRRGMVMQTTDELTNIRALFQEQLGAAADDSTEATAAADGGKALAPKSDMPVTTPVMETESEALKDLSAIPIYFASSYAMVKPYVSGFDSNVLDAPSLKTVRINTTWKPSQTQAASW